MNRLTPQFHLSSWLYSNPYFSITSHEFEQVDTKYIEGITNKFFSPSAGTIDFLLHRQALLKSRRLFSIGLETCQYMVNNDFLRGSHRRGHTYIACYIGGCPNWCVLLWLAYDLQRLRCWACAGLVSVRGWLYWPPPGIDWTTSDNPTS